MNVPIPKNFINIANYIARSDYIFNQKFKEIEYENNRLSEITDNSTVYCWSGFLNGLFEYLQKSNLKNITLISGCEDIPVNPNGNVIGFPIRPIYTNIPCPQNIIKWYAQNAEISSNFMIPMPIGPNIFPLTSNTLLKYKKNIDRKKLIFTNFNLNSNPSQRNYIRTMILNQCSNAIINPPTSIEEYTTGLQEHIFALCPPGNGKDTHRAWEALLFGCIPIVEKSNMNDFYSKFFPFLVVDRWSDITEKYLYDKYDEIYNKKWKYDLLDVDNFFNYFNIKISNKHEKYQQIVSNIDIGLSPETTKNILYI